MSKREMKTARSSALVAALTASVTCTGSAPIEAPEVFAPLMVGWLVDVVQENRPEESRTYTYPCPNGGELEVTVAIGDEKEDRKSGRWDIELEECGPGNDRLPLDPPDLANALPGAPTIPEGYFTLTSETVFDMEAERRRFEARVEARFSWVYHPEYDSEGRIYMCGMDGETFLTELSGVFETSFHAPYTGSLVGKICGGSHSLTQIPAADFPGSGWNR